MEKQKDYLQESINQLEVKIAELSRADLPDIDNGPIKIATNVQIPLRLLVQRVHQNAVLPKYAHETDSGMDLYAVSQIFLEPGEAKLIPTGLKMQLPSGFELQVRPRSGLALKHGVTVLNSPGTIDEGYRGEVGVILINQGFMPFRVEPGTRIAQGVLARVDRADVIDVESLGDSLRGEGGFGSTGV